jgi:glycine/D-amino acid oxidase-like deaminating enzyme
MSEILRHCWWLKEAMARPEFEGEPAPPLSKDTTADVMILGGGYTGLWTAWHLKQADPGLDVVLLEQDKCGFGPSGRNGGFLNGWYDHVETLEDLFGADGAVTLVNAGSKSVADVAEWCETNDVDAWVKLDGYVGVATSPAQEGSWRSTLETARRLGLGDRYIDLDAAGVAEFCRSPVFGGGYHASDGGTVQPARLARGLRRKVMEKGVRVYEDTPVLAFREGSPAAARTPNGVVTAPVAVIAVNAWAAKWKRFRRTIASRASHMVITEPAPDKLEEIGWTSGLSIWDHRSALRYLRTTPDGRIALGVGSEPGGWSSEIGPSFAYSESGSAHAEAALRKLFPNFADVPIADSWGGPIDVSAAHNVFFGTLPSGDVHYGLGYTGNGVGPSQIAGRILSARAMGREDEYTQLPFVDCEPKRFPPEPLKSLGAVMVNVATIRRDDQLDDRGRVGFLTDQVARIPRRLGYHLGP